VHNPVLLGQGIKTSVDTFALFEDLLAGLHFISANTLNVIPLTDALGLFIFVLGYNDDSVKQKLIVGESMTEEIGVVA
jgi:hypothetical protein